MFKKLLSYLDFGLDKYTKATDSGKLYRKPVRIIYLIIGYLHYIFPLIILIMGILGLIGIPKLGWDTLTDENATGLQKCESFFHGTGMTIMGIVMWVLAFALAFAIAYMAVKFWKDRADRYNRVMGEGGQTEFQVLPTIINFIRSKGEWQGLFITLLFAGGGILFFIFGVMMSLLEFSNVVKYLPSSNWFALIISFILFVLFCFIVLPAIGAAIGYGVTCIHRFFAELLGMRVSVATNVGRIKNDTNIISKK